MTTRFLRILLSIILLLSCLSAFGKKEKAIRAKWKVGEEYTYLMRASSYKVSENGDTTLTGNASYRFSLKVGKKSKSGYILAVSYPTSVFTEQLGLDLKGVGELISVDFATDKNGELLGAVNPEYVMALAEQVMDATIKSVASKNPSLSEAQVRAIAQSVVSPEKMSQTFSEDLQLLLWPYGLELEPGYDYTLSSETVVGQSAIPVTITYYISPQDKGDDTIMVFMDSVYDSDALKPFVTSYFSDIMSSIGEGEALTEEFKPALADSTMELEDSYSIGINDSSTIPVFASSNRSVIIYDGDKTQEKIQTKLIQRL